MCVCVYVRSKFRPLDVGQWIMDLLMNVFIGATDSVKRT